jgi:hypothetical protein
VTLRRLRRQTRFSARLPVRPALGEQRGSLEIVDDLAGARPMPGRDHEKDVPSTETVERVIGHAACFNADRSQVITPSHRRLLVLECADRLPALHARVADQNGLFLGDATVLEARDPHIPSVRPELVLADRSDQRQPDVRIRSERLVAEAMPRLAPASRTKSIVRAARTRGRGELHDRPGTGLTGIFSNLPGGEHRQRRRATFWQNLSAAT